jgi:hypothetical protein
MTNIFNKINQTMKKFHIGHGIAALALMAALTGTAACVLPASDISTHSLTIVSTISGAASTIISARQVLPNPEKK